MSITSAEIKQVILAEDDFRHELVVGNLLNPARIKYPFETYRHAQIMEPIHGETYTDPRTNKPRQFDYRTKITRGNQAKDCICLAVECKNLNPELPVVVCNRQRTRRESYHVTVEVENNVPLPIKKEGFQTLYVYGAWVGKSILRLKLKERKLVSDGDSEIYDRWSQALASAHELLQNAIQSNEYRSVFVIPIVVVPENSLWSANYREDGSLDGEPEQVEHRTYYVAHKFQMPLDFVVTHIHFMTVGGLEKFLMDYANSQSTKWDEIFAHGRLLFKPNS